MSSSLLASLAGEPGKITRLKINFHSIVFLGKTDVTKTHLGLLSEVVGFAFSLDFGLSIILRKVSVLYIVDLMN